MVISIRRSGGFAGTDEQLARMDLARVPAAARQELERIVSETRFFELPAEVQGGKVEADVFRFAVTVEDGGRAHTVTASGSDWPDDPRVRRLVERVVELR